MPAVQGDLRSLLASAEVHADVVQDLGDKGCVSLALFANWFDKVEEITKFLDGTSRFFKA